MNLSSMNSFSWSGRGASSAASCVQRFRAPTSWDLLNLADTMLAPLGSSALTAAII